MSQEFEFPGMYRFTDGSIRPSFGHPEYFGECFRLTRQLHGLDVETGARRIWMTPDQLEALEDGSLGALPTPWGLSKWGETIGLTEEDIDDLGMAAGHPPGPLPTDAQMRAIFPLAMKELLNEQRGFGLVSRIRTGLIAIMAFFDQDKKSK